MVGRMALQPPVGAPDGYGASAQSRGVTGTHGGHRPALNVSTYQYVFCMTLWL